MRLKLTAHEAFYGLLLIVRVIFLSDIFILPVLASATYIILDKTNIAQTQLKERPALIEYEEGVVLVRFKEEVKIEDADLKLQRIGKTESSPEAENFYKIKIPAGLSALAASQQLKEDPRVISAEPNIKRHITLEPSDSEYQLQWHLYHPTAGINAPNAWETTTGSKEVIVAIIDTGVDLDHPDIRDNLWINEDEIAGNKVDDDNNGYVDDVNGYDFVNNDGNPNPQPDGLDNDGYGGADTGITHGTHVAGTIAAVGNNNIGVSGVAWQAAMMVIKTMDDEGAGFDDAISNGIHYAVDNDAKMINMSLGGFGSTDVLASAVEYAVKRGVLIITAAGNNGININTYPFYPICYDGVLGVSSTGTDNKASAYANFGSNCVDVSAPGENIYSTIYTNNPDYSFTTDYGYMSGTSMSTPVVSGVTILLKTIEPTLSRAQLIEVITSTAQDVKLATSYGSGRLDAATALTGGDTIDRPEAPEKITAYTGPQKKVKISSNSRSGETTPYFTWDAGADDDGLSGYYVYFGTDPTADPVKKGIFQTERFYVAREISGNNRSYYLRVVSSDIYNNTSVDTVNFVYRVDTIVRQPKKLKITRSDDGMVIDWQKVQREHVVQYLIRRGEITLNSKKIQMTTIAKVDRLKTDFEDQTVKPQTRYRYRVAAADDLGHKRYSAKRSIKFYPRQRIVMAAGAGYDSFIRVYNLKTGIYEQTWRAFDIGDRSGAEITVGNFDQDRYDEIAVSHSDGGSSQVKIFDPDGSLLKIFMAYEDDFFGGVRLSSGNLDEDAEEEIIVAPGAGKLSEVKIFDPDGTLLTSFLALNQKFSGGVFVAGVNWNGGLLDEIAVAADKGGGPEVVIYSGQGEIINIFEAYDAQFRGGIRLSRTVGAVEKDQEELLTIPASGATHLKQFALAEKGPQLLSPGFVAMDDSGATVSSGDLLQRDYSQIVIGSSGDRVAEVRIYDVEGETFYALVTPYGENKISVSVASGWLVE